MTLQDLGNERVTSGAVPQVERDDDGIGNGLDAVRVGAGQHETSPPGGEVSHDRRTQPTAGPDDGDHGSVGSLSCSSAGSDRRDVARAGEVGASRPRTSWWAPGVVGSTLERHRPAPESPPAPAHPLRSERPRPPPRHVMVTVRQVQRIVVDDHPALRGVEAVATIVPLFIVVFAYTYVWMSYDDPSRFTQPIDRVDGLYFVVTVLSTVGFGDISPVSSGARLLVTVQMLLDLVLIGVVAKLIVGASQVGVQRRRNERAARRRQDRDVEPHA